PIDRQAELFGDEVPGKLDGAVLEVIAEREVAEHLEEGVMARGVTHIVEIVVLAAGAHAFLRAHRARIGKLLEAGKDVLELHHAGIGEHQRGIVARHERRRRHHLVAVLGEVVEESRPDLVDAAHSRISANRLACCASPCGKSRSAPGVAQCAGAFTGASIPWPESAAARPQRAAACTGPPRARALAAAPVSRALPLLASRRLLIYAASPTRAPCRAPRGPRAQRRRTRP